MTRISIGNFCRAAALALAITTMAGCSMFHPKPPPPPPVPAGPKPAYTWDEEKAKANGLVAITVVLSEQRAYFYKGDMLVGDTKCSSGKKGFGTPPGRYLVTEKNKDHVSNLYGKFVDIEGNVTNNNVDMSKMKVPEGNTFEGAKMPFFMRFTGGYGLHAGIVPNHPASHGCVRLPRVMAEHFYDYTPIGTPVTVQE
jgi:lipoprotein-anchoring transpeptidase ErfK/SrfK